jgi:iron complex outermembrane receptor protein
MFRTALLAATAVSGLVVTSPALGQAATPVAVTDEGLGEIVVTAQRRVENVQNVPVAVTVLSADTLDRNDVRDLSRVEILTPGFSFGRSGSDARPAIRGVRTENVGVSGDPTIGFFVDNIYRSRASQANEPFVDVERVEVQRGPQGTLYGRNTFGGNVSVTTARPTDKLGAGLNLTYGSFDRMRGDGFVNVPITDTIQVRVAGLREKMDGYVKGTTDDLDIYNRDTTYARASLRFKPVDALEAVLSYSYWQEKGTGAGAFGYRVGGIFLNPTTGAFDLDGQPFKLNADPPGRDGIPDAGGVDRGFPINTDPLFYPGDTKLEQDQKQHVVSLNLSADLGFATLRSITGYVDYKVFRNADNDFSLRKGNVDGQEDKLTALSQEVQLASNGNGPLQWILGYFFFEEDVKASIFSSCPTAARNTPGCAFAAGLPRTTSNAVFGQASYWIIPDKLRLTGGIRYTSDKKEINRANAVTDTNQRITQILRTGQRLDFEFNKTTWRANAEFYVNDDSMLYATVSTGFRSGGFNAGVFTNPLLQGSFGPENVTAYEIGSKNRFFDNKVQLNLSVYRNEFSDLQVQNQFLVPATGGGFTTTSIILNAAKAHSQGIEVELQAVPVPGLNIAMSGTLMEAKYDDYKNTPAPANYTGFRDLTGNDVPYSPNFKLTGVISYDFDLGGSGVITPQVTLLWSGSYFNTDFNTVLDKQDSFAKLDLRLGWRSASDKFSAEVFVNNVTDQITQNRATFGSRGLNESFDAPRMYGVRVGARF